LLAGRVRLGELARRERLEDDRSDACRLQPAVDVERHRRGREREQPVACRLLQLLAPEEDVGQAQRYGCCAGSSPAPSSLPLSPAPTSAFRRARSWSTWPVVEICASSR